MLSKQNILTLVAALGAAILGAGLIVGTSSSFQKCINQASEPKTAKQQQPLEKGSASLPVSESYWSCAGQWVNENDGAVTALSTVLLAAITLGLVMLGFEQSRTSRRQLRAYVFPDSGNLYDGSMMTPPQPARSNCPGLLMNFKNSGATPAKDVVSWANIDVIEPRHEATLAPPALQKIGALNLGAGTSYPKAL